MPRTRIASRSREAPSLEWGSDIQTSKLRLFGLAVLCAKVSLVPLVFDASLDMPFVVSKALLSHGLAYVLAATMIGLLIRFGSAFFVPSWLHLPVLAFLVASAASAILAVDPVLALYGTHARMLGLGTIADGVVLYFAIVLLIRTRLEGCAVVISALVASAVVLAYEGVQLLGRDPFVWNVPTTERPFSAFGQPTTLALYLTALAVGVSALGLTLAGIRRPLRVLALLFAGVLLAGAAATATRSSVLGIVAGGAVLILLIWILHPSKRVRAASLLGAALGSAGLAALLLLSPLGARILATVEPRPDTTDEDVLSRLEPSTEVRLALYQIALGVVRERPVLGYGPDNFEVGVARHRSDHEPVALRQSLASSSHSWVTYVATSSGLLGLGAFTAIGVVAFLLTLRSGYRPLALAGIAMLAAFLGTGLTTVDEVGSDWLFWVAAGAVAAATTLPASSSIPSAERVHVSRRTKAENRTRKTQLRRFAQVLCVAVGVALALTTLSAWEASRLIRSSQLSRLQGGVSQAINSALLATRSDPQRAEYWHGLGLAYVSGARWRDASAAFDRASSLAPYDVRNLGDLAQVQLVLANSGDGAARARALQLAEQAVSTDRNNPGAHVTRASVMQATGNLPESLRSVERALALDPQSGNVRLWVIATQVYLDSKRPTDAVRVARQGVTAVGQTLASVSLRYELARALVAVGQPFDALAELDAALSIEPNNSLAQRLRAEIVATIQK